MVRQTKAKVGAIGKVKNAAKTVSKSASRIKSTVKDEIIPEIIDSFQAVQGIGSGDDTSAGDNPNFDDSSALTPVSGASGLPDPSSIQIQGLDKIAPLLNVNPFDPGSFAAAGHVAMSKPDYEAIKGQLEGYNRNLETLALGFEVVRNTLKLASKGAEAETERLNYGIKHQAIATKNVELQIAQSGTRQTQTKLKGELQKETFLSGEQKETANMLTMKLDKIKLLAQQQAADLRQVRQQTEALIGGSEND